MKAQKRTLGVLAKNYQIDPDELLITLWNIGARFEYLKNDKSIVYSKDVSKVKTLAASLQKKIVPTEFHSNQASTTKYKHYDFSTVGGFVDEIKHLSKDEVLKIHEELTNDFSYSDDPISPAGIKHPELLESAVFHPKTSYNGSHKYPTIQSASAALMYSLTHNHPFHNGNKRTAIVSMLVLLGRHQYLLVCDEDELFRVSVKLAAHKLAPDGSSSDGEIFELAHWIKTNGKYVTKGERSISLRKLRQRLAKFNCQVLPSGRVERKVTTTFFGIPRTKTLVSKGVIFGEIDEGKQIDKGFIKALRDDLELNPQNGIDADAFYSDAEFSSSDFINQYRNLLNRLSKV